MKKNIRNTLITLLFLMVIVAFSYTRGNSVLMQDTSFSYRYPYIFHRVLNSREYPILKEAYLSDKSFPVPGNINTNMIDFNYNSFIPQGLARKGRFYLTTAYDAFHINKSVVYVTDGKHILKTIVLPDVSHVGGITYDGEYIWIAKGMKQECSLIHYSTFDAIMEEEASTVYLEAYDKQVKVPYNASCITYDKGKVYVVTYAANKEESVLISGNLGQDEEGEDIFVIDKELYIPDRINGVTFYHKRDRDYLIMLSSYGRKWDSYLLVYDYYDDLFLFKKGYVLPPMGEEIISRNDQLYVLFESSCNTYSRGFFRCNKVMDRVVVMDMKKIIP